MRACTIIRDGIGIHERDRLDERTGWDGLGPHGVELKTRPWCARCGFIHVHYTTLHYTTLHFIILHYIYHYYTILRRAAVIRLLYMLVPGRICLGEAAYVRTCA